MERGTGAALVVVGCILIYLSVFGISALPFRFAIGSSFTDPFDSIVAGRYNIQHGTYYTGTLTANGQLHFAWSVRPATWEEENVITVNQYDFSQGGSISLDVSTLTGGTGKVRCIDLYLSPDPAGMESTTEKHLIGVRKNYNSLFLVDFDYARTPIESDQKSYTQSTGSLKIEISSSGELTFIGDGITLGTMTFADTGWTSKILYVGIRCGVDQNLYGDLGVDNLVVAAGSNPPPNTGNLQVIGYYDSIAVTCTASYTGPTSGSSTSVPATGYTWTNLPIGSYTVTGVYTGITKTGQASVTSGQTVTVQLNFGGSNPPPINNTNIFQWLIDLFNDATTKVIMLISGVGLAGIGAIGLLMPSRRYGQPNP